MKNGTFILLLCLLSVLLTTQKVHAQQSPQYTQFVFNQLLHNPAYAGISDDVLLEVGGRGQWIGIQGAPFSQALGFQLPIPLLKSGLGITIHNDILGANRMSSAFLTYAYSFKIGTGKKLSIGLQGGVIQGGLRGDELVTPDGIYNGGIDHQDNLLANVLSNGVTPDFGLGLYFNSLKMRAGLAAFHLLEPSMVFSDEVAVGQEWQLKRNFHAHISYDFSLSNTIMLTPSLLLKSDLVQHQLDGLVLGLFNEIYIGGIGWRGWSGNSFDAVSLVAGMHVTNYLMLSYSYDISLSALGAVNSGSHELSIRYKFQNLLPSKEGKARYNPRDL